MLAGRSPSRLPIDAQRHVVVIGHHMHGLQVLFSMVPQPALQSHKGLRGRETTAREKGGGGGMGERGRRAGTQRERGGGG